MRYFVDVEGRSFAVERTETGVRIDDREVPVEERWLGPREVHLLLGTRSHHVYATRIADGWRLGVEGRSIDVRIEDARRRAIRELAGGAAAAVRDRELRAPMPGLVIRVLVEPGQKVAAGQSLVVVEAMKMENELRAEGEGIVGRVCVEEGQAVDRNDPLIVFEVDG